MRVDATGAMTSTCIAMPCSRCSAITLGGSVFCPVCRVIAMCCVVFRIMPRVTSCVAITVPCAVCAITMTRAMLSPVCRTGIALGSWRSILGHSDALQQYHSDHNARSESEFFTELLHCLHHHISNINPDMYRDKSAPGQTRRHSDSKIPK